MLMLKLAVLMWFTPTASTGLASPRPTQGPQGAPAISIPPTCIALDQIGSLAGLRIRNANGMSAQIIDHQLPGIERGRVKRYDGRVIYGSYKGQFEGSYDGNQHQHINIYPEAWVAPSYQEFPVPMELPPYLSRNDLEGCTARMLAYGLRVLAHEWMHSVCPPHGSLGSAQADSCNDMNYGMGTADAICDQIGVIQQNGLDAPITDGGDPPMVIDGLDNREAIHEFCKSLEEQYMALQQKYNTAAGAMEAHICACGNPDAQPPIPPYQPGPGFPDCPEFPEPPGGYESCDGGPSATYPMNMVIPDCPHSCPPLN